MINLETGDGAYQLTTNNFYSESNRNFYFPLLEQQQCASPTSACGRKKEEMQAAAALGDYFQIRHFDVPNDVNIAFVYVVVNLILLELHQAIHGVPDGFLRLKLLLKIIHYKYFSYQKFFGLQLLYRGRELADLGFHINFKETDREKYVEYSVRLING